MPLTETEWGLVTSWVRDHLLDDPDPRTRLLGTSLTTDFVTSLPLTPDRDANARLIVGAARRDVAQQRRLLDALARLDALDRLDAADAVGRGMEVRALLGRLREDEEAARDAAADPFEAVVLRHGTEVFLGRAELRETLRRFVADPEQTVLVVDGEPDSGRSYTYRLIRHLGQHRGFRPVRVTLARTSTAERLVARLWEFVAGPEADGFPLNPTRLNDPLPSIDDAVHRIVSRATAAEDRFWLVLDECDALDPNSDVFDCIGKLALAIYEHTPVRKETVPRLVLLGYETTLHQLPYDIRNNECRDTAVPAGPDELRDFFGKFLREAGGPLSPGLVTDAADEVLRAAEAAGPGDEPGGVPGDSPMRRLCTATEQAVRIRLALAPGEDYLTRLRTGLRSPAAPVVTALPELRRAYREAACLLESFDPAELRLPDEREAGGRAALELVDDCTASAAPQRSVRWTLTPEVRTEALRGLTGPEAARRALAANAPGPDAEPGVARAALALLSGAPAAVPPDADVEQLSDLLQAVLWLGQVPGTGGLLPSVEEVQRRLERARLLQPLRLLVRDTFHGRSRELDSLRAYLALPAEPAEPPVLLHGIGGIGKSTLLARFLLDALKEAAPDGFPFACIDFERPTLSIHEPATVIAESARQLGIQYPEHREAFDALAERCGRTAGVQRGERSQLDELSRLSATRATYGRDYSAGFHARASAREQDLARELASLVAKAVAVPPGAMEPPLVIAVDSFEEAQYRGSPLISRMWAVWTALRAAYPRLRFVVAGRAPIDHPARVVVPRDMELTELDEQASVDLLMSAGIDDESVARGLYARVGGHPLSLRLAARTALSLGADTESLGELLSGLTARRRLHTSVDQMLIQGTLYDRLLKHIADPELRALVQAGLALRVITPDLVREVLAGPAGVAVPSTAEAGRFFGLLTSRLDLMESAGPLAIRHRPDLRSIMLRLSDGARTDLMRAVDTRAVAYYAARDTVRDRAEEIYHRLRLGENPRTVEARWRSGVEAHLVGADRDMAPRSAAFLLGRIGGHVPDQVMAGAEQEDWERIAAREVEDLLTQGYVEAAARRLAERQPWTPCSRLHALLVETLARSGRTADARETAERAVDRAAEAGCAETRLELLQLSARLAQDAGDFADADRDLQEAEGVAAGLGLPYESIGVLVARSRLAAAADADSGDTDARLARRLRGLPDEDLARQPALARAAAVSACRVDPPALARTLRLVGLPEDDEAVVAALARRFEAAMADEPQLREPLARILDSAAAGARSASAEPVAGGQGGGGAPMPPDQVEEALREARRHGTLDSLAWRALTLSDRSGDLLLGVAEAVDAGSALAGPGYGPVPGGTELVGLTPPPDQAEAAWRKEPYLDSDALLGVENAAMEAGLADRAMRGRLFAGIKDHFWMALLPQPTPFKQIQSDLRTMNRVERLMEGEVPLELWLRNAIRLAADPAAVAVFQAALDHVVRDAAGEPELPAEFLSVDSLEEIVVRDDMVPFEFLHEGFLAGGAVARVTVPPYEAGRPLHPAYPHVGTGWLIAPGLLVTNHHVVNARNGIGGGRAQAAEDDLLLQVRNSRSRFDYGADQAETEEATAAALVAWDPKLDYAVLRLTEAQPERQVLRVATDPFENRAGDAQAVNIIQHPKGMPKRVALRNNLVYQVNEDSLAYFTDTQGGSSGSPVFTDRWTVVALHRGARRVNGVEYQGRSTTVVNVGTQLSRILAHLRDSRRELYEEIMAAQAALPPEED
ncbi:trypsin-like peptidase domain-containing protein [Streptomyces sp. SKN60]|uniref:trypsin-like peptidase domain-containing protein n=1 Tax=Streptomyces sp. SKN60 TaxID=2855506 RepID=UPI0022475B4B|nr:trypsin-like peptidase domain-containing protein [Streptomyces sp. SKN60]MCX2180253.1 trypsin-like peptidase domain-containing protein [Streptomyces sp. SKN60]